MWSCSPTQILMPAQDGSPSYGRTDERVEPAAAMTGGLDTAEVESEQNAEDLDTILEEFLICRRPGVATGGKTVKLQVNCMELSVDSTHQRFFSIMWTSRAQTGGGNTRAV